MFILFWQQVWKFFFCSNLPFSCRWQLPPSPTHSLFPESSDAASTRALVFTCRAHKRKSALDVCSRREGRKNNKKSKHASSHMKQTDGQIFFAGTFLAVNVIFFLFYFFLANWLAFPVCRTINTYERFSLLPKKTFTQISPREEHSKLQ